MPGDELFKRYLEIGASVLGMSRERAENIARDLVASGEVAKGQATKAADWLVERGRSGSEELAELVRREIRQQVTALGLATKDDVAGLRAEIDQLRASAPAPARKAPARKAPARKAPAQATKAVASRPPVARRPAPAGAGPAGSSRTTSVRTRSGPSGPSQPGAAPPAGGADPAKG